MARRVCPSKRRTAGEEETKIIIFQPQISSSFRCYNFLINLKLKERMNTKYFSRKSNSLLRRSGDAQTHYFSINLLSLQNDQVGLAEWLNFRDPRREASAMSRLSEVRRAHWPRFGSSFIERTMARNIERSLEKHGSVDSYTLASSKKINSCNLFRKQNSRHIRTKRDDHVRLKGQTCSAPSGKSLVSCC